jgi:hypothetical protein
MLGTTNRARQVVVLLDGLLPVSEPTDVSISPMLLADA